ncbi:hypothetical protein QEH53_13975 [Pelagicoccus sp. SDUM812002]|nr:hypothetical protein [Pelagicoccus sp. SDUM812002]MDQ8186706.1 hypothetical protein [Pelagicoccus sp. SDUM812002]
MVWIQTEPAGHQKSQLGSARANWPTGLGERAVISDGIVETVSKKPQVVESLGQASQQLPLAFDVVPEEQEHQFEDDLGIEPHVSVAAVFAFDKFAS